jgi:hypothetical protein
MQPARVRGGLGLGHVHLGAEGVLTADRDRGGQPGADDLGAEHAAVREPGFTQGAAVTVLPRSEDGEFGAARGEFDQAGGRGLGQALGSVVGGASLGCVDVEQAQPDHLTVSLDVEGVPVDGPASRPAGLTTRVG